MIIKKLKSLSTFWRMTLISFISIVVIFLITYISQFIVFRVWTIKYEKEEIQSRANELEILLNNNSSDEVQKEILESMNLNAIIYNSDNKEILNTMDEKPKHFNYQKPSSYIIDTSLSVNNDKVSLITPVHIGNHKYYMYLERESELYDDFLENTILIIVFMLIIGLIISLIAGIYISRQFIKKLNNLSNTMKEVQEKGITSRVYIQNPKDEFDKVNIIFNEMMDSVEHSFGVQRQFVQDASHELRTPLTILKGHLKMLDRWGKNDPETLNKSLKISLDEVDRLTKLVNDLLELGKLDNKTIVDEEIEKINLEASIDQIIYDFEVIRKDVDFKFECEKDAYIYMNKKHFKQLFIIFIDNAIKYCEKDEKKIQIKVYREKRKMYISIKDNGIGIEKEEIPKITDKFYRVDKSRKYNNSFGIGLSIAAQIINLYKYKLKIKSEVGIGTEILIECNQ
ncbi:sensor histidine kinase [Paraclostridium dentum]|uniref:sensor histidine kinase n=1 Tax=Paraclostridium dentum TaxID=2662455 RepID=UPI003B00A03B